jgi:hypothetical protein
MNATDQKSLSNEIDRLAYDILFMDECQKCLVFNASRRTYELLQFR